MRGVQSSLIEDIVNDAKILDNPASFLLNYSWRVLNEENENEVVVFQKNNKLIYSKNGAVEQCTWEYIPVNKTIMLNLPSISYMLLPLYYVDNVIYFQIYSTHQYIIFMNEQNYIINYKHAPFIFESFIKTVYESKLKQLENEKIQKQKKRELEELGWQLEKDVRQEMEKHRFLRWCSYIDLETPFWIGYYAPMAFGGVVLVMMLFSLIFLLFGSDIFDKIWNIIGFCLNIPPFSFWGLEFGDGFWWGVVECLAAMALFMIFCASCGVVLCIFPFLLLKIGKRKENRIRKQLLAKGKYWDLR